MSKAGMMRFLTSFLFLALLFPGRVSAGDSLTHTGAEIQKVLMYSLGIPSTNTTLLEAISQELTEDAESAKFFEVRLQDSSHTKESIEEVRRYLSEVLKNEAAFALKTPDYPVSKLAGLQAFYEQMTPKDQESIKRAESLLASGRKRFASLAATDPGQLKEMSLHELEQNVPEEFLQNQINKKGGDWQNYFKKWTEVYQEAPDSGIAKYFENYVLKAPMNGDEHPAKLVYIVDHFKEIFGKDRKGYDAEKVFLTELIDNRSLLPADVNHAIDHALKSFSLSGQLRVQIYDLPVGKKMKHELYEFALLSGMSPFPTEESVATLSDFVKRYPNEIHLEQGLNNPLNQIIEKIARTRHQKNIAGEARYPLGKEIEEWMKTVNPGFLLSEPGRVYVPPEAERGNCVKVYEDVMKRAVLAPKERRFFEN